MLSYKSLLLTLFSISFSYFIPAQNPKREMRGVWVATIKNLDWPSKPGLNSNIQKHEIDDILAHIKELGFNAIFLQIRPSCDAFYYSSIEPWSKYLTGKQGVKPKPLYDPLKYWINSARMMGIEIHAWINPYRLTSNIDEELSPDHPVLQHPNWVLQYGDKLYLDPGITEVKTYINKIITEIVANYDLAGIHMDDYFYPYPVNGVEFPDTVSFKLYCDTSKFESVEEWRRDNVNRTVESIHNTIKDIKSWVAFGISPFGVWRNIADDPDGSNTNAGITNYDNLYADILTWLKNEWVDYIAPQIYWYMDHPTAGFKELSYWWNKHSYKTPVYAGLSIYKINSTKPEWQNPSETPNQIKLGRELEKFKGNIFFRYSYLKKDILGLQDTLKYKFYSTPTLTPIIKGNVDMPPIPIKKIRAGRKKLKWKVNKTDIKNIKYFVIYSYSQNGEFNPNVAEKIVSITGENTYVFSTPQKASGQTMNYRVSAVDKYGNEGEISKVVN